MALPRSTASMPPLRVPPSFRKFSSGRSEQQAFDVSELGLTYYLRTLDLEDPPFIALPDVPESQFPTFSDLHQHSRAASPRRKTWQARPSASSLSTVTMRECGRREFYRTSMA